MAVGALLAAAIFLLLAGDGARGQEQTQQNGDRQGKNLLDWIGLGTGPDTDPYMAQANSACLNGDLAECFKSRALGTFDEFFGKQIYQLTDNARILRMPDNQLRQVYQEPFEFSERPRANEPEWDQLVKFVMRKVERFMKSTALEVNIDQEVTENGKYEPRFVDEIADEIDLIEDKKDSLFKRKQLKKLFIPLLLVLKIFKLKLLLFLPLILGLASFKKILGFFAILIPGAVAYFRLCKPDFQSAFGGYQHNYNVPQYTPAGIGYQPGHFKEQQHSFGAQEYHEYGHGGTNYDFNYPHRNKELVFKDTDHNHAQNLAYNGWQFRSNDKDIEAEQKETSSKKSILPDS